MQTNIPKLPPLYEDTNKYSRGSLLVLAGSKRYFGAGVLATLAAERTGAGYVTLATPHPVAQAARAHVVCSPVIEAETAAENGSFAGTAFDVLAKELTHLDALCCGPGLTVNEETTRFVASILNFCAKRELPLLLDADALNILSAEPSLLQKSITLAGQGAKEHPPHKPHPLILTPHAGEFKRLFAAFAPPLKQEKHKRISLTQPASIAPEDVVALSWLLDAVVVAKGPTTLIASEGQCVQSKEAGPVLAKAGTGDVLSGIISSLLAQGMAAFDASVLGVSIHSMAGTIAAEELGTRGATALDVVQAIPKALVSFENEI